MIVTWVAPVLFERAPSEYLLGLFIIPLALAVKEGRPGFKIGDLRWAAYILLILILYPAVFKAYNIFGLILLFLALKAAFNRLGHKHLLTCLCIFSLMIFSTLPLNGWEMDGKDIFASRNYYGIYRLTAFNDLLALHNGTTLHGSQFIIGDEKKEGEPTSYYHRSTPAGALLQEEAFNFKRIGIVGLGAGTLAAYAKTGQEIDFFELDNDVYDIADLFFTYLKRSPAKISYIFGDARVQLRNKPADLYDLLIVDAFSGDSVPVHLLTLEAIEEYRRHLKADGIILFHISNRYLDLAPVLYSNARALNAYINLGDNPKKDYAMMRSIWVAFSWDGKRNELILSKFEWEKNVPSAGDGKFKPWTDLYSNIASVFKFELLLEQVKNFKLFYW
jgi:spermidine synthase